MPKSVIESTKQNSGSLQALMKLLFFYVYACMLSCFSRVQLFVIPWIVQPARLLCPWDFVRPLQNVISFSGGIFLMQGPASFMSPALASGFCTISATWETPSFCMKVKMLVTQSCPTLRHHGLQPARLLCPWDSPGKNTGVPQVSFIAGRFLTV